jgi:hypothetical protein
MSGTKLSIPLKAAGTAMELVGKAGRETKAGDVMMWVGTKTDKKSGEMKGQIQGVRAEGFFKNILNFFKGRRPATGEDIVKHFQHSGMSEEQAQIALSNVTMDRGKEYLAKSVREQVDQFHEGRRAAVQKSGKADIAQAKLLPNSGDIRTTKTDIELTLTRVSDGEVFDYEQSK